MVVRQEITVCSTVGRNVVKRYAGSGHDLSVLHMNDTIGLSGEFVVMRDNDERRSACLIQGAHQSEQSVPAMRVQVAGRLIGQDQVRTLHQCTRHRDPLLFAARQLSGLVLKAMPQSDFRQKGCGIGSDSGRLATLHERRHAGILQRGELGEQVMELKYESDPPIPKFRLLCVSHPKEILPIKRNGPPGRFIKGSDNMEQGAFAGSRSSHDRHQFASVNLKIDPLEDGQFIGSHGEGFMEIDDFDHGPAMSGED